MIGSELANICLAHLETSELISLVRKPSSGKHNKLNEIVVTDFMQLESIAEDLRKIDAIFCCAGVYTGKVDDETFELVTTKIPVALAEQVYAHSPEARYCFLSGQGADRTEKSRMIFARTKGAAENQISAVGLKSFHTFRPGYIYPVTPRDEPNLMYRVSRSLYPVIRLMGKNMSIKSTELAQAMFEVGRHGHAKEELENRDILSII